MCSSHARLASDPLVARHFNLSRDDGGRIVVPVSTLTGESGVVRRAVNPGVRPKEIWSSAVPRGQVLYNADRVSEIRTAATPLYLVDTFAETWALWRAGYERTCALTGCLVTTSQATRLQELAANGPIVLLPGWDGGVRSVVRQNDRALRAAGAENVMVVDPAHLKACAVEDVADLYLNGGDVARYLASALPATELAINGLADKNLIEP